MKLLNVFISVIAYSCCSLFAVIEQSPSISLKSIDDVTESLNRLSKTSDYEELIKDHYNRFHALTGRREWSIEFLSICQFLSLTEVEPSKIFSAASGDKGKQLMLILALVDVSAERYIEFGEYLLAQVINGNVEQDVFVRHYLLANANKKQFFFSMNYEEKEVRDFLIKVKSQIAAPQVQEWIDGILSGDYAARDRSNFFDNRPEKAYDKIDRFKRHDGTLKPVSSALNHSYAKEETNGVNNEKSNLTIDEILGSSQEWIVIVVLFVSAVGLLLFQHKGRK